MKPTTKYNHKSKNIIAALGIKGGKKMESKLAKIGVGAYVQSDCMSEAVEFIVQNVNTVEEAILAGITCGSTAEKTKSMHSRPSSSSPGDALHEALMAAIASGGKSLPPGIGIGVIGPDGERHMLGGVEEEGEKSSPVDEDEEKNNGQGYIY